MNSASRVPYFSTINGFSKNFVDVFAVTANSAAAAQLTRASVGIYAERKFMLTELNQYAVASCIPTRFGAIGLHLNFFNHQNFRETEPSVSYSKKLGAVDFGIAFNFRMISIPAYGSSSSIIAAVGSTWHISEKLHTGLQIFNPPGFFSNSVNNRVAYHYASGLGYEVSQVVFIGLAIRKEENRNVEVNTALQYRFADQFFAALGISSSNTHARFAFGYQYHSLRMEVTCSWNSRLGISPGLMLIYIKRDKGGE